MLPDLFSRDLDSHALTTPISAIAKHTGTVLLPSMDVQTAMRLFDLEGTEVLTVAEANDHPRVWVI